MHNKLAWHPALGKPLIICYKIKFDLLFHLPIFLLHLSFLGWQRLP